MILINKRIITIIAFVLIALAGFFYYINVNGQTVKITSQNEAETQSGIQLAAKDARIKLLEGQAKEAADLIKELKNKPPEYVVTTTVKEVPVISEQERKNNNADFSIVTKPDEPDKVFNPDEYNKDNPVVLNQYNIKAYKDRLIGVSYYPKKYISVDYNKKVSNSGHYLGVALIQDLKDNKTYFGVRYSF